MFLIKFTLYNIVFLLFLKENFIKNDKKKGKIIVQLIAT